jgi:hypothetical protein
MHPTELLTTADVAAQAGVHVSTVTRAVALGELEPAFRAPGQKGAMWFEPAAVHSWLTSRLQRATPPGLRASAS